MTLWRLPRLLLGIAGAASLAYVALRSRGPATMTRASSPASLGDDLRRWLPKLPHLPFIRIEIPATRQYLRISGDGATVRVDLPQTTARQRGLAPAFRRICAGAGGDTADTEDDDGKREIRCVLPAQPAVVARLLDRVLRELYGADNDTALVASVPSRP